MRSPSQPTAVSTQPAGAAAPPAWRVVAVVPAYRARATLLRVVERALGVVDEVIVVEDACPDRCGDVLAGRFPDRVQLIRRAQNGGVGAATKTGFAEALERGADVVVKIDADDQMDSSYVPAMVDVLRSQPRIDLVKGNRFADPATLHRMPKVRLIGNAGLTFLVKFSSGYWTIVDPTNGFLAVRARALRETELPALADRYFFEIDLLCAFGLQRREIAEMQMPAIYAAEPSSLSIANVLLTFPGRLLARFLRRIVLNYLVVEINVGTLCAVIGIPMLIAAIVFGAHEWYVSVHTGEPRPTGTIILALLLFTIGVQLSLQALLFDVQFATKTLKVRREAAPPPAPPVVR